MKKWVKILGVLGGLGLAGAGVAALCKKSEDDDYVEGYVADDEGVADDSAEQPAE